MSHINKKMTRAIKKIGEDLDTVSLSDLNAWNDISAELEEVIKNVSEWPPELYKLLNLCLEGMQAISENKASDSFSLVDAISGALAASEEYLPDNPDCELRINKAASSLTKVLNKSSGLSLNDVAALLVQIEPDDSREIAQLKEALDKLAGDETYTELSRENIVHAAKKIEEIIDPGVSDPDLYIAEAGKLIESAINAKQSMAQEETAGQPADSDIVQAVEEEAENNQKDYMPEDADAELLAEFVTEGLDLITNAEEALLTLENDPEDMDAVGTVFRAFHTIKGTGAFMDLTLLSEMAHHAENLLSRVRDGEIRYSGGYADLALRSLDMLKELIQCVEEALAGNPLYKTEGYDELMGILENPEKAGISESSNQEPSPRIGEILVSQGKIEEADIDEALSPRIGDILVAQGTLEREEVEKIVASRHPDVPIGEAIVQAKAASVEDVGKALRTQRQIKSSQKVVQASVRVATDRLDRLIDMVGELVIANSMVAQDEMVVNKENHNLLKKVGHTSKIVRELQDMSMSMRMVPLKATFQKMVRLVRDLSHKAGKEINFIIEGEDTEIDRNMADAIKDPLVHMVRNAVDHGIELPEIRDKAGKPSSGQVRLSAYHSAGNVVVEIQDDGKGLDREALLAKAMEKGLVSDADSLSDKEVFNLIFEPGFSTAKTVTDISGRGVGMDVVRKNIEAIRGQVEIQSDLGKGSIFQMRLPLTLAIIDGMAVRAGSEIYIVPTLSIITSIKPEEKDLSSVLNKGEMLSMQGKLIPLFRLADLFNSEGVKQDRERELVVVVDDEDKKAGLLIDELIGRQQVVIKSLGKTMQGIPGVAGGAIMPDGRVGLILDIGGLVKYANAA